MSAASARGESVVAARNALSLGSSLAVTGSMALLIRMMVPRLLGPGAFGEYRLAEAAAEVLFVVLTFGVDGHLRREAALDPARARGYLAGLTALRVLAGAAGIAVVAGALRWAGAADRVVTLFLLMGAAQVLQVLNNTYSAFEHAAGDVRWIARANLAVKVLWAAALVAVLVSAPSGAAIAAVALAIEVLRFAWLTSRGVRRHGLSARPDLRLAAGALLASLPFFVNLVAHTLYARIGTGWIAAHGTEVELGLHGAASGLASIALLGMPLVSWVLVPSAARAGSRDTGEVAHLVSNALRTSLLAMVPVALAFNLGAPWLLALCFGEAYTAAAPVLRVLAPTFALAYASTVCAVAVIQEGRIWTVTVISLAGVALTAGTGMMLVPFGAAHLGEAGAAQGAAWATLVTEVAVTAALAWFARGFLRGPALARTLVSLTVGCASAALVVHAAPQAGAPAFALAAAAYLVPLVAGGAIDGDDLRFCRGLLRPGRIARAPEPAEAS